MIRGKMKNESVKIELKEIKPHQCDPPHNSVKSKESVSANRFALIPKQMPHLSKNIKTLTWDSLDCTLSLMIQETPRFEVYQWLQYIKQVWAEAQQGPFIDLSDCLHLIFYNSDGEVLTTFKFGSINVLADSCSMPELYECDELRHYVTLSYKKVQMLDKNEDTPTPEATNELADEEWQTIEGD